MEHQHTKEWREAFDILETLVECLPPDSTAEIIALAATLEKAQNQQPFTCSQA